MKITTVTSREFNQNISKIKKDTRKGPVFITDRGHPAHVLQTIKDYRKLTHVKENIVDLLAMPEVADIKFEPTKLENVFIKSQDF